MIRPDSERRSLTREFQLGVYARMEETAQEIHAAEPERSLSHIQGALAAGLAASLITNLAQRGSGDIVETADRLLETIRTAEERGDIEQVEVETSEVDEEC